MTLNDGYVKLIDKMLHRLLKNLCARGLRNGWNGHSFTGVMEAYPFPWGLLPDAKNCGLRMRLECWERFPRHRLQRKPLVSDPGVHHGTCVTRVPWCMLGSLTRGGGENVPGIPGACATCNFTYLARGPCFNTAHRRNVCFLCWVYTFSGNETCCKRNLCRNRLSGIKLWMIDHIHQFFFGCNYSSMSYFPYKFKYNVIDIRAWINHYIHCTLCDMC